MTARRASSSPQAVVQTLFRNLLFLSFYCSLFTRWVYYLRSITSDLLPLGYYHACIRSSHSKIGLATMGALYLLAVGLVGLALACKFILA